LLHQEIVLLTQLIKGERPPANGMEVHFLRVVKGKASACSQKEKEWYQFWLDSKGKEAVEIDAVVKYVEEQESVARNKNLQRAHHGKPKESSPLRISRKGQKYNSNMLKDNLGKLESLAQMNNKLRELDRKRELEQKALSDKNHSAGESSNKENTNQVQGNALAGKDYVHELLHDIKNSPTVNSTWKVDEGIAGTREENKKMRGQLWGDMRNRGRGR
jgi:hypothetical protein